MSPILKRAAVPHYLSACLCSNTIKIYSRTFYLLNKGLWRWLLRQEPSLLAARMTKAFSLHPHNTDCEQIVPVLMLSQISLLYTCSHCLSRTHIFSPAACCLLLLWEIKHGKKRAVFAVFDSPQGVCICGLMCVWEHSAVLNVHIQMCSPTLSQSEVRGQLMEDAVKWFQRLRWRFRGRKKDGRP